MGEAASSDHHVQPVTREGTATHWGGPSLGKTAVSPANISVTTSSKLNVKERPFGT